LHSPLTAIRRDGSLDPRFGEGGQVRIRIPWKGRYEGLDARVSLIPVGRRSILVLATNNDQRRIRIIRIRPLRRG